MLPIYEYILPFMLVGYDEVVQRLVAFDYNVSQLFELQPFQAFSGDVLEYIIGKFKHPDQLTYFVMNILQSDSRFYESVSSTVTKLIDQNKQYFSTRVEDAKRIIYGLLLRLQQI